MLTKMLQLSDPKNDKSNQFYGACSIIINVDSYILNTVKS